MESTIDQYNLYFESLFSSPTNTVFRLEENKESYNSYYILFEIIKDESIFSNEEFKKENHVFSLGTSDIKSYVSILSNIDTDTYVKYITFYISNNWNEAQLIEYLGLITKHIYNLIWNQYNKYKILPIITQDDTKILSDIKQGLINKDRVLEYIKFMFKDSVFNYILKDIKSITKHSNIYNVNKLNMFSGIDLWHTIPERFKIVQYINSPDYTKFDFLLSYPYALAGLRTFKMHSINEFKFMYEYPLASKIPLLHSQIKHEDIANYFPNLIIVTPKHDSYYLEVFNRGKDIKEEYFKIYTDFLNNRYLRISKRKEEKDQSEISKQDYKKRLNKLFEDINDRKVLDQLYDKFIEWQESQNLVGVTERSFISQLSIYLLTNEFEKE